MGTGELAKSPSLLPPSQGRLCKVTMAFAVGKERVDSEVLWEQGRRAEGTWVEEADMGTVYGGSQVRPRTSGAG